MLEDVQGENPTRIQLIATYGMAVAAAAAMWFARPFEWQTVVLMLFAADIAAGVVANAAKSTRQYWAKKADWVPLAFVGVHLAELPILWWLSGGDITFWVLALAMATKLATFWLGQEERRGRAQT